MKQYTFHLLGLTHLPTARKYTSCAFTQKNIKLAKMLTSLGHIVYLYGARSTEEAPLEEYIQSDNFHFVETHTVEDIAKDYGTGDSRYELNYAWPLGDFKHDLSTDRKPSTLKFYANAIEHINKVKKSDDFLLATQGQYHKPIADAVGLFLQCESGIGYRGWCEPMFHCFESYYGMHFLYGSSDPFASLNGRYFDRRIFNYFDVNDFELSDEKDDYFLFIGRMIKRKGVLTAYLATKATGDKLIFAGQGAMVNKDGHLVDNHPQEFDIPNDSNWEYVGYADLEKRKKLMSKAKAVFVATEYLEMFGGVAAEAMLSGTPVITTSFGVFPEYNIHGKTGFLCHTLQDFVDAVQAVKKFTKKDYQAIRQYAVDTFSMDVIKYQYQKWFDDLHNVYESTVSEKKGWHRVALTDNN